MKGGWVVEKPSRVVARWVGKGIPRDRRGRRGDLLLGVNLPASGLDDHRWRRDRPAASSSASSRPAMPSVTMPGAMVRAMLAAYRRTLEKTMQQARSMQQVVDQAGLTWLETPDQAVVWGTALGLQGSIESVLAALASRTSSNQPQLASIDVLPGLVPNVGSAPRSRAASRPGVAARSSRPRRSPISAG